MGEGAERLMMRLAAGDLLQREIVGGRGGLGGWGGEGGERDGRAGRGALEGSRAFASAGVGDGVLVGGLVGKRWWGSGGLNYATSYLCTIMLILFGPP